MHPLFWCPGGHIYPGEQFMEELQNCPIKNTNPTKNSLHCMQKYVQYGYFQLFIGWTPNFPNSASNFMHPTRPQLFNTYIWLWKFINAGFILAAFRHFLNLLISINTVLLLLTANFCNMKEFIVYTAFLSFALFRYHVYKIFTFCFYLSQN